MTAVAKKESKEIRENDKEREDCCNVTQEVTQELLEYIGVFYGTYFPILLVLVGVAVIILSYRLFAKASNSMGGVVAVNVTEPLRSGYTVGMNPVGYFALVGIFILGIIVWYWIRNEKESRGIGKNGRRTER